MSAQSLNTNAVQHSSWQTATPTAQCYSANQADSNLVALQIHLWSFALHTDMHSPNTKALQNSSAVSEAYTRIARPPVQTLDILHTLESTNMTSIGRVMQVPQYPDHDSPDIRYNNCTLFVVHTIFVHQLSRVLAVSKSCIPCPDVTDYTRLIVSFACAGNAKRTADHLTSSLSAHKDLLQDVQAFRRNMWMPACYTQQQPSSCVQHRLTASLCAAKSPLKTCSSYSSARVQHQSRAAFWQNASQPSVTAQHKLTAGLCPAKSPLKICSSYSAVVGSF